MLPEAVGLRPVGEIPFQTTHRAVVFVVFEARVRAAAAGLARGGRRWVTRDELGEFALSNAAKRVLGL
jgi:hypothetical protein